MSEERINEEERTGAYQPAASFAAPEEVQTVASPQGMPTEHRESASGKGEMPLTEDELRENGFTSSVPWKDEDPDCLVIACSDHRFQIQTLDLIHRLGFASPHIVQFPSGITLSLPLIAASGFLSRAADKLVERIIEAKDIKDILCIAHEDCGAYTSEKFKLLDFAIRRLSGKPIRDIQIEHLQKAARRLRHFLRGVTVRAFFADVVGGQESQQHVNFKEIHLHRPGRKRTG